MPPKKREKDGDSHSTKTPRIDHIQADHELFLQAFEKPTQIYRYLRTRNLCSPIFIYRTLTYMKYRMKRSHKTRSNFKVDSILERVTSLQKASLDLPRYMNVMFLGYYDASISSSSMAQIDSSLMKISYKKRKDSSSQKLHMPLGCSEVDINPLDSNLSPQVPAISIPSDSFALSRGPLAKSYTLCLKVRCINSTNDTLNDEPLTKRRKSVPNVNNRVVDDSKTCNAELIVYDKLSRCILTDGDYDIQVEEITNTAKLSPKKHVGWENASDLGDNCENLKSIQAPLLRFRLAWSQEPLKRFVDRPVPYVIGENKENLGTTVNDANEKQQKIQVIYQFVYNNNSRQQTEACEDFHCPWCSLNCNALYTLLKHLKLCHPRFIFTYVPITGGARIDVAINELYDGSYTGSPHDLIIQPTVCAFSRNGPVRRASVTHIFVCHPKRSPKTSISEFLEPDDGDYDGQRPFVTGHDRLYYHTTTSLPIYPKEMEIDSEGENDPEWLQVKTKMMLDEFTDVNEGEKEVMKMWNLHIMKNGFVGDCQIPLACSTFVEQKGKEILLKNLYRNFVLHLNSLIDYGILSPACFYQTILQLQELIGESDTVRTVLRESFKAQTDHCTKSSSAVKQTKDINEISKMTVGRKAASLGSQRRKGVPAISDTLTKRKPLTADLHRKRLSVTLHKTELKASGS